VLFPEGGGQPWDFGTISLDGTTLLQVKEVHNSSGICVAVAFCAVTSIVGVVAKPRSST
jgi:alanyl-tRNA synthetase